MSISNTWCSTCTLIIMCCMIPEPSLSQNCSIEKMENVVIDMMLSLSKGVRGTEPIYTPTQEVCINVCCLEKNISGDRQCNLMIFDARRAGKHPNCYLFYCPSKESCPMKPAKGLVSYRINRGIQILDSQLSAYDSNRSSLSSQAAHFDLPNQAGHLNHTAALQKSITSQMTELLDHIEEHLDKIELHTQFSKDQEKKHPNTLDSFPKQKITNLLPTSAASMTQPGTSTLPPSTTLPTITTTPSAIPKTTTTSSQIPTTTAFTTTDHGLRTSATTFNSVDTSTNINLFSSSAVALLSKDSFAPFQDDRQLESENYLPHGVPKSKHVPQSGGKSGLIAAFLFGMVFLLLVIALLSRRMSQSLQRRRYTRLDYLINGMYADV
uniref:MANSC domain containing 1 n=1 Tax=Pelusios castaneus TaxID=367368 RepID=A0A8C8RFI2_9SAUR